VRFRLAIAVVVALVILAGASTELSAALSFRNEKASMPGVSNFGRVNAHLFRGAQPTPQGLRSLAAQGVQVVVRLSLGEEGAASEAADVRALGMESVTLPWSVESEPDRDEVRQFLQTVGDPRHRVVFVHCKQGADRTGVMIAMSRIAIDGWTPERAMQEMRAFHYHDLFHWHLHELVEAFPHRLRLDAALMSTP
jgi:protein tyrosine/serine phosphatase